MTSPTQPFAPEPILAFLPSRCHFPLLWFSNENKYLREQNEKLKKQKKELDELVNDLKVELEQMQCQAQLDHSRAMRSQILSAQEDPQEAAIAALPVTEPSIVALPVAEPSVLPTWPPPPDGELAALPPSEQLRHCPSPRQPIAYGDLNVPNRVPEGLLMHHERDFHPGGGRPVNLGQPAGRHNVGEEGFIGEAREREEGQQTQVVPNGGEGRGAGREGDRNETAVGEAARDMAPDAILPGLPLQMASLAHTDLQAAPAPSQRPAREVDRWGEYGGRPVSSFLEGIVAQKAAGSSGGESSSPADVGAPAAPAGGGVVVGSLEGDEGTGVDAAEEETFIRGGQVRNTHCRQTQLPSACFFSSSLSLRLFCRRWPASTTTAPLWCRPGPSSRRLLSLCLLPSRPTALASHSHSTTGRTWPTAGAWRPTLGPTPTLTPTSGRPRSYPTTTRETPSPRQAARPQSAPHCSTTSRPANRMVPVATVPRLGRGS